MIKYTVIDKAGTIVDTQVHEDTEAAQGVIFNAADNSHNVLVTPSVDTAPFVASLLHPLNWIQRHWGYEAHEGCNTYCISFIGGKFIYRNKAHRSLEVAERAVYKRRLHNLSKMIKLI